LIRYLLTDLRPRPLPPRIDLLRLAKAGWLALAGDWSRCYILLFAGSRTSLAGEWIGNS
jgi:hypothetical protein